MHHTFQGDFLSGVISKFLRAGRERTGVLLRCLLAEIDLDFDLFFSLSLNYHSNLLGVLFYFSSLSFRWDGLEL